MVDLTTAMAWQMERNAMVMLCAALGSAMGVTIVVHVRHVQQPMMHNATLKSVVYEQLVQISISAVLAKVLPNAAYFCLLFLPNTHPFVVLLNDTQIFISN